MEKITEDVIADCNGVRQRIYSKREKPDMSILDDLDYLSYSICEIADAAELCRCVHVDFEHRRAAEETVFRFSDYMLLLGHDKKMYDALCSLTEDRVLYEAMDDEQVMMVKDMKNEFERDGVHLGEDVRARLRNVSSEITSLEADFQKNSMQIGGSFAVPADAIKLLPREMYVQATNEKHLKGYGLQKGTAILHTNWLDTVLGSIPDPRIRESFYKFCKSLGSENIKILEELIAKKTEKAKLLGFDSYADLVAREQMLGSTESINDFLMGILRNTDAKVKEEINVMKSYKTKYEKIDGDTINVWDIPFYSRLATGERFQEKFNGVFELEDVLAGLEYVCFELFGLKLDELPVDDSEDWTKGLLNKKMHVRKLVLYDVDADGNQCEKVGTIYLDLYPRLNKVAGATHFALRHSHRKFDGKYQLPVVFLNTNFAPPESLHKNKSAGNILGEWVRSDRARKEVSYLKHDELQTLFHEFGHALHTLLSRTRYQHLAGTRVKTDFVEIPSHLMEYFVRDYRVLKHFVPKGGPGESSGRRRRTDKEKC